MEDNAGSKHILNNMLEDADKLKYLDLDKGNAVYEVIRIIEGVPLFIEDHYERLKNSLDLLGLDLTIGEQELGIQIRRLVNANKLKNCNVKVVVYHEGSLQNHLMYISRSYYPSAEEVQRGVKVGLLKLERKDPNIKLVNKIYKDKVSRSIEENNVFEVLLVNEGGNITEGSKSNVFFVKGGKVYTAPGDLVLKGITRKYVIDACKAVGHQVEEALINVDSLNDIEGLFISGTSIKVLPVSDVGDYKFKSSVHPVIVAIRDQFDRMIEEYILEHKTLV